MKLLVKKILCLSLLLSIISACQSSPEASVRYGGQTSRFYAPNRTPTVSDEFRSDADLERAVNQSFKKSQISKNNLTESQAWDASKQVSTAKQKVTTSYASTNNAVQTNKQTYTAAGQYYIQAGCYSREDVALSQVAKLKANGISNVHLLNEGGMSKVRVGPYTNKESGISILNKMKNQLGFVDSFWKY